MIMSRAVVERTHLHVRAMSATRHELDRLVGASVR
jgi:hypothetical protein